MIEQQTQAKANKSGKEFSLHTPVLTTSRLVLRPPMLEDIDDLAEIANNAEIAKMTSRMPHPYSRDDALEFITAVINGKMEGHIYAVTLAETGRLIGMTAVENRNRFGGLEVGYWIGRRWWGMGYASEACSAVVDLAFRVTGTEVIYALSRTINAASRQVLVKQGFEFVGADEVDTVSAGRVAVERYRLARAAWLEKKAAEEPV